MGLACLNRAYRLRRLFGGPDLRAWPSIGNITYDASSAKLEEILNRNLVKSKQSKEARPGVLTTRNEALALYRDIVRASRLFVWKDELDNPWKQVIRESTRREFETARHETNPEIITRLLVSGRDSLQQALIKFMARRKEIMQQNADLPNP